MLLAFISAGTVYIVSQHQVQHLRQGAGSWVLACSGTCASESQLKTFQAVLMIDLELVVAAGVRISIWRVAIQGARSCSESGNDRAAGNTQMKINLVRHARPF